MQGNKQVKQIIVSRLLLANLHYHYYYHQSKHLFCCVEGIGLEECVYFGSGCDVFSEDEEKCSIMAFDNFCMLN